MGLYMILALFINLHLLRGLKNLICEESGFECNFVIGGEDIFRLFSGEKTARLDEDRRYTAKLAP